MSPKPPDQPLHLHLVPDTGPADGGPTSDERVSRGNPVADRAAEGRTCRHEVDGERGAAAPTAVKLLQSFN